MFTKYWLVSWISPSGAAGTSEFTLEVEQPFPLTHDLLQEAMRYVRRFDREAIVISLIPMAGPALRDNPRQKSPLT